jgi:hypothetical protein
MPTPKAATTEVFRAILSMLEGGREGREKGKDK